MKTTERDRHRAGSRQPLDDSGLRARFDATPLPLALLDGDRRFVDANAAALGLLHASGEQLAALTLDDLVSPDTRLDLVHLWEHLSDDERHLAVFVPTQRRRTADPATSALSGREREVLSRIADGQDGPEIARELVVSPATVRTHVGNALRKLGARSRAHAVAIALRSGLLDEGELDRR
jgi:DNA-binding CsgD family transcriptional regulator